jgi:pyruvate dehydrogenase E2 component (dihydrolipoamide acetyltransferase)
MVRDLVMPQLGLTMTEGKVLRWYKNPGEMFKIGEPILEIETDKVNMDVEATDAGKLLEIVARTDEVLPVKTVIARYLPEGEEEAPPEVHQAVPEATKRIAASPRARALAKELGVDLALVKSSGPGGRIVEGDVRKAAEASVRIAAPPTVAPPLKERVADQAARPEAVVPASNYRRVTAERMTRSFQSAPHFYVTREIDASDLSVVRRTLAAAMAKRGMPELTVTDLLLKAVAGSIAANPAVNVTWKDDRVFGNRGVAVGFAVATENGLIVPVVREADQLNIVEIARRRAALVERARSGQLKPDDLGDASATLSNLGMYGVDQFQAILNPPESLIVATGAIRDRVVARNGSPVVRPTLFCTVSADHRVLDGTLVARFLASLAEALENPGLLLLSGVDSMEVNS